MKITDSESLLIKELKNDSSRALEGIYNLYADRLYAFCLRYSKSREDSEELVEDVFVWLWNHRHQIRQEDTLKSILFIRMRHFLINAYRARVNAPVYEDYLNYQNQLTEGDVKMQVEYDEFVERLEAQLKKLPLNQQRVIRLAKFEGLKNHETAERLGLSEQTVKNLLSLGLKAMRDFQLVWLLIWRIYVNKCL